MDARCARGPFLRGRDKHSPAEPSGTYKSRMPCPHGCDIKLAGSDSRRVYLCVYLGNYLNIYLNDGKRKRRAPLDAGFSCAPFP